MPETVHTARLRRLMTEAASHVALYRRLWGGLVPDPAAALPCIDKAALRGCPPEDRIHDGRRDVRLAQELSSGSSGEPLATYSDRRALLARRLAFLRALLRAGYRPGQRCLLLTSRRGEKRWPSVLGWQYASIADSTETLAARVTAVRPHVLYGPLSTLELLAQHFVRAGARAEHLRLVVSTAEQLTPARLAALEQGLPAPVADFYGLSEFGLVAFRAPGSREYRPARASLVFEYAPVPGEPALERLVITDLAERTSPLIRYDTGDLVRRDATLPRRPIVAFAGRAFDCIRLPDGERLSPYLFDVALECLPSLRAFEVVQQRDLSLDVTIDAPETDAERLRAEIAVRMDALLRGVLPFRIASGAIRRDPAGAKFRPIRSLAGSPS